MTSKKKSDSKLSMDISVKGGNISILTEVC